MVLVTDRSDLNKSMMILSFYECVHYIQSSVEVTKRLLEHKESCINVFNGVESYRVRNIIELLDSLYKAVESERELSFLSESEVEKRIINIKSNIDEIRKMIVDI